jgi:hypothetical protein
VEFNELRRRVPGLSDVAQQMPYVAKVADKWSVPSLIRHPRLFQSPDDSTLNAETIPRFEAMLTTDVRDPRLVGDLIGFVGNGRLWLSLDLASARPVDSLCALIDAEVRQVLKRRGGQRLLDHCRQAPVMPRIILSWM